MKFRTKIERQLADPIQAHETFAEIQSAVPELKKITPNQTEALLRVWGNSSFLARWCRRFPHEVLPILQNSEKPMFSLQDFINDWLKQSEGSDLSQEKFGKQLIRFKYRHLFRITLRDLAFSKYFLEIVSELTDLSKTIVQVALDRQSRSLKDEWGDFCEPIPFLVLAMGKMGGQELNFSSDLDLIYAYGTDQGDYQGPLSQKRTPHEFFVKLAERLSRFLSQKTADGFLYRIDLELRPEGKSGPLANSLQALEHYYENFGASWEKQAMLKAAHAAGSELLFENFRSMIHPFVYPRHTDFTFLTGLREMKRKIIDAIKASPRKSFNVKLGEGGIREIEFFVQSLQILFGGKIPALQTRNTLKTLAELQAAGLINLEERQDLESAYIFLRTLEHRLQLIEEEQTHQLPEEIGDLQLLARRMGYAQVSDEEAASKMMHDLEKHRRNVTRSFAMLLNERFKE